MGEVSQQEALDKLNDIYLQSDIEKADPRQRETLELLKSGVRISHTPETGFLLVGFGVAGPFPKESLSSLELAISVLRAYHDIWHGINDIRLLNALATYDKIVRVLEEDKEKEQEVYLSDSGFGYRKSFERSGRDSIDTLLICGAQTPHTIDEAIAVLGKYGPKRVLLADKRQHILDLARLIHPEIEVFQADFTDPSSMANIPEYDLAVADFLLSWNEHYCGGSKYDLSFLSRLVKGIGSRMDRSKDSRILIAELSESIGKVIGNVSGFSTLLAGTGLRVERFVRNEMAGRPHDNLRALREENYQGPLHDGEAFQISPTRIMSVGYRK